jgi:hypothetical protein
MRRRSIVGCLRPPVWQPEAITRTITVYSNAGHTSGFVRDVIVSIPRMRFLEVAPDRFADLDRRIDARLKAARKEHA